MPRIPTSRLGRTAKFGGLVAGQGARWVGTQTANRLRSEDAAEKKRGERAMSTANEIVAQLGQMKGAAMKIGQVLSTLEFDVVPEEDREEFQQKLAALRDNAPRVPYAKMQKLVEEDLGAPVDEVFAAFDPEPIAAASIGQVYRATTRDDGREVAVKVQYPGIAEAVETDLRNANMLFPLVKRLAPGMDVKAVLGELRERIGEELDYEIEAQNQRRVARAYRNHPFIHIPAVDTAMSTRRVLVTDFAAARPFDQVRKLGDDERDRFGEILFRFYFGMLNREHFASGDPHPGNVLLGDDGRVVFLDFGLMRVVPDDHLEVERGVARSLIDGNADGVKQGLADAGYLPDPGGFEADLLLEQLQAGAAWYLEPGPRRITGEYVRELMEVAGSPRSPYFDQMRRQTIPPASLLVRRMEGLLFAVLGELRAKADWNGLMREILLGGPPSTPLGEQEAEWRGETLAA